MLLSRTARHVWINARRNVMPPPPDPPEYLSEPKYAYLLFERFCMVCFRLRASPSVPQYKLVHPVALWRGTSS